MPLIQYHSVHWGINPLSKTSPTLSCQALPSYILVFREPPPHPPQKKKKKEKKLDVSVNPKNISLSFLTPSYLLIVTKFLVKNFQFEFLVIIEKNIFVYKCFLSLNISDFSLFFVKIATPLGKSHPPLS